MIVAHHGSINGFGRSENMFLQNRIIWNLLGRWEN